MLTRTIHTQNTTDVSIDSPHLVTGGPKLWIMCYMVADLYNTCIHKEPLTSHIYSPHVITGGSQLCTQTGQRAVKVSCQTSINIPRRHGLRGGMGNLCSLPCTSTCLVPGIACLVMVTDEKESEKKTNNLCKTELVFLANYKWCVT